MVTTYVDPPTREEVEMQLQLRAREYALAVIGSVHDRKLMDQLQPEFKLHVLKVIKFFVTSSEADCKRAIARYCALLQGGRTHIDRRRIHSPRGRKV